MESKSFTLINLFLDEMFNSLELPPVIVKFKQFAEDTPFRFPDYPYNDDIGLDLYSNESVWLYPYKTTSIGTGLTVRFPLGVECQIRARSGNASRGIIIANGIGTIDPGYRGELRVLAFCLCPSGMHIKAGTKIAQVVFAPVFSAKGTKGKERGRSGFGSSDNLEETGDILDGGFIIPAPDSFEETFF